MILAALFISITYVVSKFTSPPKHETWEEIQTKIDNQTK